MMNKEMKRFFVVLCFGLMFLGVKVYAKEVRLDSIAAVVNEDVITNSELNNQEALIAEQLTSNHIPLPPLDIFKKQVLQRMIVDKIQIQKAHAAGFQVDDLTLNKAIKQLAANNDQTVLQFKKNIEQKKINYNIVREAVRKEILINQIQQKIVGARIRVTPQEITQFLNSAEGKKQNKIKYRLSHILIALPEQATQSDIKRGKKLVATILKALDKGKSFPQLAVTFSNGQNALKGGDLGWRQKDELPTLLNSKSNDLKKGLILGPFRNSSGFHIFMISDVKGLTQHILQEFHVRHILIKPNALRSTAEAKKLIESLYQKIKKGTSFSQLAKENSDDSGSALKGGDIGWVQAQTMVPAFRKVMDTIQVGVVSHPFKSQYGWHILEVLKKRKSDVSHQLRRAEITELLGQYKYEAALSIWLREIRDEAYVDIRLKS